MKIWWAIAAASALIGCATTEKYEESLKSWMGAHEVDLIRAWGPPQRAYDAGGSRFIMYAGSRNVYVPGQAPTYTTSIYGNTAYTQQTGGRPPMNIGFWCYTTFEVRDERLVSWRWEGNDCKSK